MGLEIEVSNVIEAQREESFKKILMRLQSIISNVAEVSQIYEDRKRDIDLVTWKLLVTEDRLEVIEE